MLLTNQNDPKPNRWPFCFNGWNCRLEYTADFVGRLWIKADYLLNQHYYSKCKALTVKCSQIPLLSRTVHNGFKWQDRDLCWWFLAVGWLCSNQEKWLDICTDTYNIQKPHSAVHVCGMICSEREGFSSEKLWMIYCFRHC